MSSRSINQEHATNWVLLKREKPGPEWQSRHGPFSNASDCRKSEAEVFANKMIRDRVESRGAIDSDLERRWKDAMVDAVEKLFAKAPDSGTQSLPTYDADGNNGPEIRTDQVNITLEQGFQEDTAKAMNLLATGKDLGTYRSSKEPAAGFGPGLDVYTVSERTVPMEWLDKFRIAEIEPIREELKIWNGLLHNYNTLLEQEWRYKQYLDQKIFNFELDRNFEVFVDKEKAIALAKEWAKESAGKHVTPNVEDPSNLAEERIIYEITGEIETVLDRNPPSLPKSFKLVVVGAAHISKERRVDWKAL